MHNQTKEFINALVDTINAYNIENKVTSESVKYLRVANGIVEWSTDNESWFALGGGGTGGSSVPGGGNPGQVLVRGDQEYTAKWLDIINAIALATSITNGLLSAEDKAFLDQLRLFTNSGEGVSASDIIETEMRTFLKNNERAQLFSQEGDALFYSTTESEELFQHKLQYGNELPESGSEGEIFLLLKAGS